MAVAVIAVRPVAVDVVRLLVDVVVAVGFADSAFVRVDMMEVGVDMGVGMDEAVVVMGMDMLFTDDEGHSGGHEQAGRGQSGLDPVAEDDDRSRRPGEGSEAEQGPRPERPQPL